MSHRAGLIAACLLMAVWTPSRAATGPKDDASWVERDAAAAASEKAAAGGQSNRDRPAKKPLVPIAWRQNIEAARAEAAKSGQCVLIYFRADWCRPCRLMEEGPFLMPAIAQYINRRFVPVRVDDSDGASPLTAKYEIRVYPSVLFLDPGGTPLHLVLGPRPAKAFYKVMKQVQSLPSLMARQRAHPESLEANFALGNALAKLNHLKRAAPYLRKAAELDPDNAHGRRSQAKLILAVVPLEEGHAKKALENLEAYLRTFKDADEVPVAIWYQGTILYQDGRFEEAREHFREITRRFPKHVKAYEADKAIEHIEALLAAKRGTSGKTGRRAEDRTKEEAASETGDETARPDRPEPKG